VDEYYKIVNFTIWRFGQGVFGSLSYDKRNFQKSKSKSERL